VLAAGEYQLKFRDVQARAFVVIQDAKSGKDIAYLAEPIQRISENTRLS
jgi:hypothetical protein